MERTRLVIHMHDTEERSRLFQILSAWMELYCAPMELVPEPSLPIQPPVILFWDLDDGTLPPRFPPESSHALFVCSADPQAAIHSYPFHPNGFLQKPICMDQVEAALKR